MDKISKSSQNDLAFSLKTPEKPTLGHWNPSEAMSLKEIRAAANKLRRKSLNHDRKDPRIPSSVRRRLHMHLRPRPAMTVLPEKYQMLVEFFNCMDCSIRLIRLKGLNYVPTFTNIRRSVEALTDRTFTYAHLAQLKFILPEVIVLKKVMSLDERTCCMKPDLHVSLDPAGAVQQSDPMKVKSGSESLHIQKVFRSHLVDFVKSHPEESDVPEGELPEPFGRRVEIQQPILEATESSFKSSSHVVETSVGSNIEQLPVIVPTHLPGTFRRHFSRTLASCQDSETTMLQKHTEDNSSPPLVLSDTAKLVHDATPTKLSSTPSKPMNSTPPLSVLSTPAPRTPKRCAMSPDEYNSNKSPTKLLRCSLPTARMLTFNTLVEDVNNNDSNDIYDILGESLVLKIQEQKRKIVDERNQAISRAKRRRLMIAGLRKLSNSIILFFQYKKQFVVAKDELIKEITAKQLGITDRGEVEERVSLLQELVPEWISEKLAPSGDCVIHINESLNTAKFIHARLANAR